MDKQCSHCKTTETTKWHSGPLCRICYRRQPEVKEREKQTRLKKKEHYNGVAKIYQQNNVDSIAIKNKIWYENNKEKEQKRHIIYRENHRELVNKYAAQYQKNRKLNDLDFKLRVNLRSRTSKLLRGYYKSGSAVKDLGCSIEELKIYLESKFTEGMTWDNYGKGFDKWNIDHIIPLASFNLIDRDQFIEACHYTNLQPLWEPDNLIKSDRI